MSFAFLRYNVLVPFLSFLYFDSCFSFFFFIFLCYNIIAQFRFSSFLCFKHARLLGLVSVLFCSCFLDLGQGMYAYACFLQGHAYAKYAYAYNWVAYASFMYVHTYSCPETLIRNFSPLFLYFFIPYVSTFSRFMLLSLYLHVLFDVCSSHARLGFLFNVFL